MFNWFDLMRQIQGSASFDAVARQFHLSSDQSQRVVAAFLPAFILGLQHAATPNDPSRFFPSMMSEAYRNFWQMTGQTFSSQAQREGRKLLDQLFGSDEVSRRVAHQAADYAGVSADTMQQILPLLAGIMAGGMAHWMTAQAQAFQSFASPPGGDERSQPAANPWAALWTDWMKAAAPAKEPAANPFNEMMARFLQAATPPQPPPQQESQPSPPWGEMMDRGREMQAQYLASLQSIFEDAWKIDKKRP